MRFASLGSGSRGNATVIASGDTRLLVDCGFSVLQTERRLARLGCNPTELRAILVTHEHVDHIRGVAGLARKYALPVWLTAGTWSVCKDRNLHGVRVFPPHEAFELDELRIQPFPVPHDAREPCQFVFEDDRARLGLLTDTGSITPHIEQRLNGCHALMLECNYDPELMRTGPYPPALKSRVTSPYGHLANHQTQALLERLDLARLRHLVAVHISAKNNRNELAAAALLNGSGIESGRLRIADQAEGFDWLHIDAQA